jgi:SPP1 family predicted phage head-tail adaptor
MQSGDLKNRLQIEATIRVSDGGGSFVNSWIPVHVVYGSIWPLKSVEQFEGGRTIAVADYRIRIRYRRTFKASWRVKDMFTGRYMSIVSTPIDVGGSHQFLEFLVKEVTS